MATRATRRFSGPSAGGSRPRNEVAAGWVLLSYRMPREPTTPRISVWRKLKRLGVAQISDGLVALPADARTQEQLEWMAEEIIEAGGNAVVWLGHPITQPEERQLAHGMSERRAAEYRMVMAEAERARYASEADRLRVMRRLRAELRRIERRDYFPPPERKAAEAAVDGLHPGQRQGESA